MMDHITASFEAQKKACLDIRAALMAIEMGAKPIPALEALFADPRFSKWDRDFINERLQELYLHLYRQHSKRPEAQSVCPADILSGFRSLIIALLFEGKVKNREAFIAASNKKPRRVVGALQR